MKTSGKDDFLYTTDEVARLLRISRRTLERWRDRPGGPPVVWVMDSPRYWRSDLMRWIERRQKHARLAAAFQAPLPVLDTPSADDIAKFRGEK